MALAAIGATGAGVVLDRFGAKRALALGFGLMALSQAALAAVVFAGEGWSYPSRSSARRSSDWERVFPPGPSTPIPRCCSRPAARVRSSPCTRWSGSASR